MPIEPQEDPPIKPGQPTEPPQESPPGNPRPEVPPPMHEPGEPPRPEELPGQARRMNCRCAARKDRRCRNPADRCRAEPMYPARRYAAGDNVNHGLKPAPECAMNKGAYRTFGVEK